MKREKHKWKKEKHYMNRFGDSDHHYIIEDIIREFNIKKIINCQFLRIKI